MKTALKRVSKIVLGAVIFGVSMGAMAAWPEKQVTLVVPFPPGGNTDTLARLVANQLSTSLGQPVIVDNKPGAGSMIGSQAVARAKPDGYTFLVGSISNVLNHYFYKKPLYDITKDLVPVAQIVAVPNYFALNPSSNIKTVSELIAEAKANPEKVSCATTGVGTSTYLSCEMFMVMAGVKLVNVPYKGGAAAMQDVMGGQATLVVANEALPYIKDNRLKGIAVTTATRSPLAPDLPAISETVPGFDVTSWYGVFAPVGTPPEIVERISSEIAKLLKSPQVLKKLEALGATPVASSPKHFTKYVNDELKRWGAAIKPMNINLD
jgi:tripartite-type tricarboxylate transporter receptor subunit TctC